MSTGCILQFMYTFSIEVRQPQCENICMIYYAIFKRTKSTHCLCRFLRLSGLSSSAKGIKCNEMPCFLSVTLEQSLQYASIRYFFYFMTFLHCLALYNTVHAIVFLYC